MSNLIVIVVLMPKKMWIGWNEATSNKLELSESFTVVCSHAASGSSNRSARRSVSKSRSVCRQRRVTLTARTHPEHPLTPTHSRDLSVLQRAAPWKKPSRAVRNSPQPQMCFAFHPQTMLPRSRSGSLPRRLALAHFFHWLANNRRGRRGPERREAKREGP